MFSLKTVWAIELKQVEVVLPLGLKGLDKSALKSNSDEIRYDVKLYQNKEQEIITPQRVSTKTLDGFMQTLLYSYKSQDKTLFKTLLDKKSIASLNINSEKFNQSFEYLKDIKKPHLKYVYEYKNGYIVSWSGIGLNTDRILYLKKVKSDYKIFSLNIDKNDHFFWNMGLYFKMSPFKWSKPSLRSLSKKAKIVTLDIEVDSFQNWVYIYNPADRKTMIAVSDNFPNNKPYKDYDLDPKKLKLKIGLEKLQSMGEDIFIVESSFPLETIPKRIHKKAIKLKMP
jgi:hypothetical protein